MHTPDLAEENFKKLAALFPNAVTETIGEDGEVVRAIDADVLRQEISAQVVEGVQERYQFTWPDKKKSVVLANQPIAKTLRLDREKSVGRDGTLGSIDTENIYIEGDNLDVLKLLQETYLGKVKMIYIDPPYNTGSDFIYEDDFSQETGEYLGNSGQFDEEGNRLVQNTESNGRFHTDWLNMLYPRLRLAKGLLSDDGIIFISIDDNEIDNLSKAANEIFGEDNFICKFIWKSKLGKVGTTSTISVVHEYIVCYSKNSSLVQFKMIENSSDGRKENLRQWGVADRREDRPSMFYPITIDGVTVYPIKEDGTEGRWRVGEEMAKQLLSEGVLELGEKNGKYNIYRIFPGGISYIPYSTLILDDVGTTAKGATMLKSLDLNKVFDFSKPIELVAHFAFLCTNDDDIIVDFFSGSATTAHATMQINAEEKGNRRFIMVQLPELTDSKSEAYKSGYKTICDIGEERIRRAGKKIKEESPMTTSDLDIGFRVFKVDSSNMNDVYYRPKEYKQGQLGILADNIKADRTPEDLLIQVMLDLGVLLSSKIDETTIAGKKVFSVANGYLIACFDKDVTDETVKAIAQKHPYYAVFRDAGMASDSVMANFEQIFETYSPKTQRKVL